MKIQTLKENEPLKIIDATNHNYGLIPPYISEEEAERYETKEIKTLVFTDGEVVGETKEPDEKIESYYIGRRKYENVDTLKRRNLHIRNHSYVITYLLANEFFKLPHGGGWFFVTKDINVYLENPKDKDALKAAKQALAAISKSNRSVDTSDIFSMLSGGKINPKKYETERVTDDVYTLKKKKTERRSPFAKKGA